MMIPDSCLDALRLRRRTTMSDVSLIAIMIFLMMFIPAVAILFLGK